MTISGSGSTVSGAPEGTLGGVPAATSSAVRTGELAGLRVGYAGTPEFARVALEAIVAAGATVPIVLTQPDRPAGRGMKLQPSPVKQLAQAHAFPVAQPTSLKLDGRWPDEARAAQDALTAARLDVLVVAAYGLILPQWVLDLPRLGCLNIHASLLPRWRGAAPIHRAIEAGDARTGVTIMQMDIGLDTGDMLEIETTPITSDDTTAVLHDRLAVMGGRLIVSTLQRARDGALTPVPQPSAGVTYAHKIEKSEAALDWALPAERLAARVRAFDPFPGGSFQHGGEVFKVWAARVAMVPEGSAAVPGTVLSAGPSALVVACGEGALEVTQMQRPGGKRLAAADVLRALSIQAGERLG